MHPYEFSPSEVESLELELDDGGAQHFSVNYGFDDTDRPTRVEFAFDGELVQTLELAYCADTVSETITDAGGAFEPVLTEFYYGCIDEEISGRPPTCP